MIIIEADYNNVSQGRVNLSRMKRHGDTPFAEIAAAGEPILFVDYEAAAYGRLEMDATSGDWFAVPDWDTQFEIKPMLGRPAFEGFRRRVAAPA